MQRQTHAQRNHRRCEERSDEQYDVENQRRVELARHLQLDEDVELVLLDIDQALEADDATG